MSALPTGTVTFLFTDLAGSTRLWQEHPEAMKPALARHDEIVRTAIEAHSGFVVKTTGDGFHAAFATPREAIGAAMDAQVALGAEPWPATGPLRVRMGIHAGPAELRDGDYYGTAVNRAARLMSVAHGGQVVVSLAASELLPDGGVELLDLGEHALRDLSRPERVFQVEHPGLDRDFPPLATLDAYAGNLPIQVTSFVGRDDDVARIVALLGESVLVTLIGTGGVGKTRLAAQVAAEVLPRFRDGAWFCELAPADDPDGMAQAVATTLGAVQRPGLSMVASIVEFCKVRSLLLVLDNCEHLLDAAGELADAVLQGCGDVTVLATSREALDVEGERVVRVRSLDAPDPGAAHDVLVQSAAVRLFADRARDAGAAGEWNDAQWAAVGEICRRVDGIPLAIELAAARATSMSPADIAAHLDERFRLLTGKRRGRVERHQTLRATVEWSYQLLDDDERAVFDRLGVFAGTFDEAAAVAVAGADGVDSWTVIDAVASLVAKSMLVTEDGPSGTVRYAMLETLRQYARERLDETADLDRWRRRHAEYYAEWADAAEVGLAGADAQRWAHDLRAELDNVRAAVGWALDADDPEEQELGVRIVARLSGIANYDHALGIGALALLALAVVDGFPADLRAPVLSAAGYQALNQGAIEQARTLAREAVRDGIVVSGPNPLQPHMNRLVVEMLCGDPAATLAKAEEGRAALDSVDSPYARANFLSNMASFEAIAGRVEQARTDAERGLALARESQNTIALASAYFGLGWSLLRDDPVPALAAFEAFLDLYRSSGLAVGTAGSAYSQAGGLRSRLGDPTGGLEYLREAVIISRDQGLRTQVAAALDWSYGPLLRTGSPRPVATFIGALRAGSLVGMNEFPGVDVARERTLVRVRTTLGDDETDRLLAEGAAMPYDDLVAYALEQLGPPDAEPDAALAPG